MFPTIDQSLSVELILAMVVAAGADGRIDSAEMDQLLHSMDSAQLSAQENAKLTAALNGPPTAEEIAQLADSPEQASELYAALRPPTPAPFPPFATNPPPIENPTKNPTQNSQL